MRLRKYLIGMIAGLVGVLALSSLASAEVTSLSIGSQWTPTKQVKKKRGPAKTFFESNEAHAGDFLGQPGCLGGDDPACYAYPPALQSLITFPKDVGFDPGNLPDCSLGSLIGKSTAAAEAACPRSIVGGGTNANKTLDGRTLNGVVTAFNGAPSAGNPSLYLHVNVAGVAYQPDPARCHFGQHPEGADPAGLRLSGRALRHDAQPGRHQKEEEQEDGRGEEDVLHLHQVLEVAYVDDHRDRHVPE